MTETIITAIIGGVVTLIGVLAYKAGRKEKENGK